MLDPFAQAVSCLERTLRAIESGQDAFEALDAEIEAMLEAKRRLDALYARYPEAKRAHLPGCGDVMWLESCSNLQHHTTAYAIGVRRRCVEQGEVHRGLVVTLSVGSGLRVGESIDALLLALGRVMWRRYDLSLQPLPNDGTLAQALCESMLLLGLPVLPHAGVLMGMMPRAESHALDALENVIQELSRFLGNLTEFMEVGMEPYDAFGLPRASTNFDLMDTPGVG